MQTLVFWTLLPDFYSCLHFANVYQSSQIVLTLVLIYGNAD